ncbi:Na(+)/H(+) antiporter NhaA [Catellatospora methionotrophica]|uniref:Na(+)/H(+) antiporter NhaA n=1 Tax=Catellatospora methionotrophica TaxID=121620 RepID=A0A8J3LAZ5_9ACTN|nr:Na+/H+ antiporter NhaA [Catellatospora methionotrophica]GIG11736.1 Na(+)/H(+) antiporter NhaA [Catellatospora methionotrophica]
MSPSTPTRALFGRGSWAEARRLADILRQETVGGTLLLAATVAAMIWANSPWSPAYEALRDHTVGPAVLHLDLPLGVWAADGLLAIFFFVAGLELKREFVAGDLREPRRAVVPVAAAAGGVIVPALIYLAVNHADATAARGWAVPTATDIAFALAVLAVVGRNLPSALRTFLLTLAVVDDLIAIAIIAVFYTQTLHLLPLAAAMIPLTAFATLVQRRHRSPWLLLPLAAATWALVHASGIHATVAGVLLAFTVPVRPRHGGDARGEHDPGLAGHFEHRLRPISAGIAVPIFALLSAGVTIGGLTGLTAALTSPVAVGITAGLVLGKTVGVLAATVLVARFTAATLDEGLAWSDIVGLSMLAGVGFTVSLLIGELSFGAGNEADSHAKIAVLAGSVLAAALASAVLRARARVYKRIAEQEGHDGDADGIPDVYAVSPACSSDH